MKPALLLLGHGSALNSESGAAVRKHASAIEKLDLFSEVRVGYWKEPPYIKDSLGQFESQEVFIVPVFMSDGYFTQQVIPRELKLTGAVSEVGGKRVNYCKPIGNHPFICEIALERAWETGLKIDSTLVVLGHGTGRNKNSEVNIYNHSEVLKNKKVCAQVITLFLDQDPHLSTLFSLTDSMDIVVVPLFIADGWHVEETIPADLRKEQLEKYYKGSLRYSKAVGTHEKVVDVILDAVNTFALL